MQQLTTSCSDILFSLVQKLQSLIIIITFVFILSSLSNAQFSGGSGTPADPYKITTLEELRRVGDYLTSSFILMNDLDLAGSPENNIPSFEGGWKPIGYYATNFWGSAFKGTFDGGGHVIKNLHWEWYADDAWYKYQNLGLFAALSGAVVKNLGLENAFVNGVRFVGGIAGIAGNGTVITNCYTTGIVSAGESYEGTAGFTAGGIVAVNNAGCTISNCYSSATVFVNTGNSGGLVGDNKGTIINCYSSGQLGSNNDVVGGLVGYNSGTITSSFWNTDAAAVSSQTTGGTPLSYSEMIAESLYINAGWDFVNESSNGTNEYWNVSPTINNGLPYLSWQDGSGLLVPAVPFNGSGTLADPYQITSVAQLNHVRNYLSKNFILMNDLDLQATTFNDTSNRKGGWQPIGSCYLQGNNNDLLYQNPFTGTFDGNGHIISNLLINRIIDTQPVYIDNTLNFKTSFRNSKCQGLFSGIKGATIKNLGIVNAIVAARAAAGAITGISYNGSIIQNCYSTGDVFAVEVKAGGLAGASNINSLAGTTIQDSYSWANVTADDQAGGLVGVGLGIVVNCYSTGSVSTSNVSALSIGGLIGTSGITVTNSFWDLNTSGQTSSAGGTGLTSAELKTLSNLTDAGWDFTGETSNGTNDYWDIDVAGVFQQGYPYLSWQNISAPASAPTAVTDSVSAIWVSSAKLYGKVNPNNADASIRFLYGTVSGTYTDSITATPGMLSGGGETFVSARITGLIPGQIYYFRISAVNGEGYTRGDELSFSTLSFPTLAGTALSYRGTGNNYVTVTPSTSLELTDGTIEFWMKPDWDAGSMDNDPCVIANPGRFMIKIANDLNSIFLNGSTTGSINYTFIQGNWYHVAWVTNGGTSNVYVNGNFIGSTNAVFGSGTGSTFYIGGDFLRGFFKGILDEVRIWNVPRTLQQIRENIHKILTGTETGLVSYWQFNEGTGSTIADLVSRNDAGIINNFGWVTSTIPVGGGTSSSISSFRNGTAGLGTVILTTTDGFDNNVDITATQITNAPGSLPSASLIYLDDRYWVVNAFGIPGTFSTNLTFTVPSSYTLDGTVDASSYVLFHRDENSDGVWSAAVTGASSVTGTSITFNGITSFSQFMIGSSSELLPVELISFIARTNVGTRQGVLLEWETATEVNNYGFEVERQVGSRQLAVDSLQSTVSNQQWELIGFVKGSGNSNVTRSYELTDENLLPGNYLYRLKQVDNDGTYTYSDIVEASLMKPDEFTLEQNYPNPFNPTTNFGFRISNFGFVSLKIYDILGKEVATLVNENKEPGIYEVTFDASSLSSGLYMYKLESNGEKQIRKMLLIK